MNVTFDSVVCKSTIPPQLHKGGRRGSVSQFAPIFKRLAQIDSNEAVKIRHDAPTPQVIHARIRTAAQEQHLDFKVKVAVRGSIAYLSREGTA